MPFNILEISNQLLKLSLDEFPLTDYANRVLHILVDVPNFLEKPDCAVFLAKRNPRAAILLAHRGHFSKHTDTYSVLRNPDCPFLVAIRSGETEILNRRRCSRDCSCDCPNLLHIVPLKRANNTVGLLALPLSEIGSPSDSQLQLLQSIGGIIASTMHMISENDRKIALASLVHENPNPVIECDATGEVRYMNPAVKKILWQNSIEMEDLLPSNHIEYIRSCIDSQGTEKVKTQVSDFTYSWDYRYIPNLDTIHIYGLDISDQRRIETQLAHDAMHDALTELPNRNHLLSILKSEISVIKRRGDYSFALLLIDLDRFKTVIESLGFSAGNIVLKEIARRMTMWNRHDKVVARLGGDEFAVILEDLDNVSKVMELAASLNKIIAAPIAIRENNITLTVSIGIAIANTEALTPEAILQNASAAVYRAKRQGINHTEVYDKEMHLNALARLRVHNELADAMESGDLTVYYQPVFGLQDLRIRGFEALSRWRHPEKGLIGPADFIPIAEETGLIHDLGTYVLKTVCRQLAIWKKEQLPLAWVSVNVSAHQFKLENLVSQIMKLIVEAGADPARLYVEITEGTAAESPERAFEIMTKLRDHGIHIALDDFGTGYSSMSYLKRFPIDTLKLDRSFIVGLPENHDDAAIATSVIAMAKSLGMKVVAEGVEDERQAMFLRAQSCDEVQGFLYGKPMPARNATSLLKAGPLKKKRSVRSNPVAKITLS